MGYDLYSADGRLIDKRSLGYFLRGRHEFRLDGVPKGVYILKVRVGDETVTVKGILQE